MSNWLNIFQVIYAFQFLEGGSSKKKKKSEKKEKQEAKKREKKKKRALNTYKPFFYPQHTIAYHISLFIEYIWHKQLFRAGEILPRQ